MGRMWLPDHTCTGGTEVPKFYLSRVSTRKSRRLAPTFGSPTDRPLSRSGTAKTEAYSCNQVVAVAARVAEHSTQLHPSAERNFVFQAPLIRDMPKPRIQELSMRKANEVLVVFSVVNCTYGGRRARERA